MNIYIYIHAHICMYIHINIYVCTHTTHTHPSLPPEEQGVRALQQLGVPSVPLYPGLHLVAHRDFAVSLYGGLLCGCPYNKKSTIWGLS